MLKYVVGDATMPIVAGLKVIVHCVNDAGSWGSGFVLAINARWKHVEDEYRRWHREGNAFHLGAVQFVKTEDDIVVANLVGQHRTIAMGERKPVRYTAIEDGLRLVADFCVMNGATIHMPRMGCGLARGEWSVVEGIVEAVLVQRGIDVTVYDLSS